MDTALDVGVATRRIPHSETHSIPNFERLVGTEGWQRLPASVRKRFAADAHMAHDTVYVGSSLVRASWAGRLLAHLCRCMGTPIAPWTGEHVAMRVRVYRNAEGIVWERRYAFVGRECIVRSTKTHDEGSLVEKLGAGLHMRLDVFEEDGALHFVSAGYYFRAGRVRLTLPDWFLPGGTHVMHRDLGGGLFRFTLRTYHPLLGEMYFQDGVFHD